MKKVLMIVTAMFVLAAACSDNGNDNGDTGNTADTGNTGDTGDTVQETTVTINVINAAEANGYDLWAALYPEGEFDVYERENFIAVDIKTVTDGDASLQLMVPDTDWMPTGTEWTGSIGESYDLYLFTDADGNGDIEEGGTEKTAGYPTTITLEKNTALEYDYTADFSAYDPQDGTVTVSVSGLGDYDGENLAAGVFDYMADPAVDDLTAMAVGPISDGSVELVLADSGSSWTATGGDIYDIYVFIDTNDDQEPTDGEMGVKGDDDLSPTTVRINGELTMEFTADDFSEI